MYFPTDLNFPKQRVSAKEKNKPEFYANSCDWLISQALSIAQTDDIEKKYHFLKGNIDAEYYKKILNPYNATNKDYQRFPATMRNYDMVGGVVRRYVGEYIQNPHDFIVGANNPEVVLARDAKLRQELMAIVQQKIAERIKQNYEQFVQQGGQPEQFNPQDNFDVEAFIKEFNENYIDDISAQGQDILNVIDDLTDAAALYARAYFEWVAFGRVFTYTEIQGNKIVKRVVSNRDAFPIPNDNILVEDFDAFCERRMMTFQQIMDEYYDILDDKGKEFLDTYYISGKMTSQDDRGLLQWESFKKLYPDMCNKFTANEREFFERQPIMAREYNNNLIEVWHVVWRGEVKKGILTYQQNGIIGETIVDEDYTLNPDNGDIDIEWIWESQVFECDRIGGRNNAIYPYKCRPIAYNRNGKLPYNGLIELMPGLGRFSIIDLIMPYQIFGNIIAYHREMALAKNKLNVLLIAKSLLGNVPEETIYRMAADGVLYIDDEDDQGMLRAQQVRMLNSDTSAYIAQLTELINANEQAANLKVDMTPQRYGEIANSAGKGVTEQAIIRGSMGSVIVEFMFDYMREHDYARDMDYTKLAWIDGLRTSYKTKNDASIKYFSLDVDKHIYADYVIKAKLSAKERDKLNQYKQFAFSAAQNGDAGMAAVAIEGDNTAEIKKGILKFQEINRQHEERMKQLDAQNAQMLQQYELDKIAAEGQQDRETLALEKYLDGQIEEMKAVLSPTGGLNNGAVNTAAVDAAKTAIEREKIAVEREKVGAQIQANNQKFASDIYKADMSYKVAKQNKNKFDKK